MLQVVCNDEFLILDLDCGWPGRTHDARVWAWSDVRLYLEGGAEPGVYCIAGDSAYPISPVLMKPYNNREALNNALMRLFNTRLSSIRTKMTENVFARWKGTFPILRMLRAHYHHAKLIIMATAILHNIAIKFGEVEPERDESVFNLLRAVVLQMDEPDAEDERAAEAAAQQVGVNVPAVVDPARRVLGQLRRDQMRDNMPRR
jgi:hypothetical protein